MNKRFLKVYESAISAYNQLGSNFSRSGFLVGDVVKFVDGALDDSFFKTVDPEYKKKVEYIIKNGANIRVVNVKSTFPAVQGAGNPDYNGYSFAIEVALEDQGLGRVVASDSVTVPQSLLIKIEDIPNLPAVPDKFKRKDTSHIKPKPVKNEAEESAHFGPSRTHTADIGNGKDSKSETSLTGKNMKIPSSPAKGAANPASYTAAYLP